MKKVPIFLINLLVCAMLIIPVLSFAVEPQTDPTPEDSESQGLVTCRQDCGWKEFVHTVYKAIDYLFFTLFIPFMILKIAYLGITIGFSGGGEESRGKLKESAWNTGKAIVLGGGAWFGVKLFFSAVGYDGAWIGL